MDYEGFLSEHVEFPSNSVNVPFPGSDAYISTTILKNCKDLYYCQANRSQLNDLVKRYKIIYYRIWFHLKKKYKISQKVGGMKIIETVQPLKQEVCPKEIEIISGSLPDLISPFIKREVQDQFTDGTYDLIHVYNYENVKQEKPDKTPEKNSSNIMFNATLKIKNEPDDDILAIRDLNISDKIVYVDEKIKAEKIDSKTSNEEAFLSLTKTDIKMEAENDHIKQELPDPRASNFD